MLCFRILFVFLIGFFLREPPVFAHWADMSALELHVQKQSVNGELTIATPFFNFADVNKNERLEQAEFQAHHQAIENLFRQKIVLSGDHGPLNLTVRLIDGLSSEGFSLFALQWTGKTKSLSLDYRLFDPAAVNAHCLVTVQQGGQVSSSVLKPVSSRLVLQEQSHWAQAQKFIGLGFEHILTGYDHLLFLFALLLVGKRFRYLVKIITTFTLAHSLTLSLAVLGWVSFPSRLIESLIAISIVYVLIVDVIWKKQEASAFIVFAFGLIHGLGFAGILKEMSLPAGQKIIALLSFNGGIEMGQLILAIVFWSGLVYLRRQKRLDSLLRPMMAYSALILACVWCLERIL